MIKPRALRKLPECEARRARHKSLSLLLQRRGNYPTSAALDARGDAGTIGSPPAIHQRMPERVSGLFLGMRSHRCIGIARSVGGSMIRCSGAISPGIDRLLKLRIISLRKLLTFVLLTLTVLTIAFNPKALAADTANETKVFSANGAKVFSANCAACHQNGGNIVRRGKNLRPKALKKYGMDSLDAIVYLVENGLNAMPAYKNRLSDQEIEDVSAYVLEQAEKGWK